MIDYHLHTRYSDGNADAEEYVKTAIEIGIQEIGISDHFVIKPSGEQEKFSMKKDEVPEYIMTLTRLKKMYKGKISIKIGIEIDYFDENYEKVLDFLEIFPFDYYIVGIHSLNGKTIDVEEFGEEINSLEDFEVYNVYKQFFETTVRAIYTRKFDILAHPDILKRYVRRPNIDLTPLYQSVFKALKETHMTFEVNLSGLRHPVKEIYPDPSMLKFADKRNSIIISSDSHDVPTFRNTKRDEARKLLRDMGFKKLAIFNRRKRMFKPL